MVDVEHETHPHAALVRRKERGEHQRAGLGLEPDVVEREVEAHARVVQERGDLRGNPGRRLAAVGERRQLDRSHGPSIPAQELREMLHADAVDERICMSMHELPR